MAATRERGGAVVVPAVVVAETTRGSGRRDARVNRVLTGVEEIAPTTEATGRIAGRLLAETGSSATVDALVVAEALMAGRTRILTTDPDDLGALAHGNPEVRIQPL